MTSLNLSMDLPFENLFRIKTLGKIQEEDLLQKGLAYCFSLALGNNPP